jgi:undecaprenyl-diphosphatase
VPGFPLPAALLVVLALTVGMLVALLAFRAAPRRGATSAAADAIEHMASEMTSSRPWLRRRLDPGTATGLALSAALVATIVAGLVLGGLALLVRSHLALRSLDRWSADWGHAHASHLSTRIVQLVTDLGDWPVIPVVVVAVAAFELRRAPSRFLIPFLLTVMVGNEVATTVIKQAVDRARPTLNPVAATLGPSFPSGHSSTAASTYAALALVLSRGRAPGARAILAGLAAGIAVAVATSRVLLDVHWLSDVIAGLALGWGWFALCAIAFGGRLLRFGAQAERLGSQRPSGVGERTAS